MGRKAKKGDFLDLDDPTEAAPEAAEEPVNASKPSKKKGKKGKAAAAVDDGNESDDAAPAAPAPAAAPKAAGGKKGKGKKGANKYDFGSDDDKDIDLAPAAAGSDEDDEFVSRTAAKLKGKGKKAAPAKSAFDLLNGDASEHDATESDEEPVAVTKPKGGAGKGKKAAAASAFDLLGEEEEEEEDQQQDDEPASEEEEEKPVPAKASKKQDKKGKKDMSSLFAALEEDGAADEPAAAEDDEEEQPAPAKASKKKDKKGKKDMSSLFAALEEDGAADEPAADEADEQEEETKPKKKDKKGKKDMSSLFAALEDDGAAANGDAAEAAGEGKKKKKKKKDMDSLFAALEGGETAEAAAAEEPSLEEDKGSKKKKDKKGKKDLDSQLASLDLDDRSAAEPAAPATALVSSSSSGKKGKKGGKAAAEEDDELAAILAELDAPKQQPAAAEPSSKKKKKKGKGGAAGDDDDIDALLAEIDGPKAAAAPAPAAAAEPAPPAAAAQAEPAAAAADDGEEDLEAAEAAGKELTAAQKKKLKKKQKEKEKKAAAAAGAGGDAAAAAEADEATAAAAPAGKKGKGPVKESAAVRRMREQLEARQKAEEEARAAEEARRKAEEEELRRLEEEEKRKAEEKERKKAAAKAKKEELKRQGKLLTGKAKAEAERLAAIRAQLLAAAAEKGLSLDEAAAGEEAEKKPKKVVYTSKKKQLQRKKSESAEAEMDAAAAEQQPAAPPEEQQQQPEQPVEPAAAPAPVAAAAAAVEAPAEKESDGLDDWEQAADSWEELDKEEEQKPAEPAAAGAKAAAAEEEEEDEGEEESDEEDEDEDESESDEESSEEESSSEEDSSEYSSSEYEEDSEEERERRIEEARDKRMARLAAAREAADKSVLRSPICCILGHVDVGKTKILDNIRRTNVQDGEAGGITQQIGATFVPADAIEKRTAPLRGNRAFDMKLPGLLVIDTPGHESFTNLRARGSGLCDIAVLIVDLMHGLEQQTIESINMLKMRKTPFIIALNKCDRLYGWKSSPDCAIREAFKRQKDHVMKEFEDRSSQVFLQLNEQGLNVSLYWKNPDPRRYVNVVPTSAITGEGIPDLLQLMIKLTQSMMQDRLTLLNETQCTVLEVKTMEGLGTTVDVVLVNGTLREGDRIVVCGLSGPIVTRIKSLKTPQVMKEMRVKGMLVEHKEVRAAMGVKIVAPGLESAVAGTSLYVIGPDDDEEELKDSVMEDMADIFSKVDKSGEGVCVQASTLGSLEALLAFLDSPDVQIPVSGINIGPVHKKDVLRANVMNEKGSKKFAVILAFDVAVSKEAREMANEYNVKIFTADIIYHLFDQFTAYMKQIKSQEQEAARLEAVFPCILQILPTCVFNKKDPIVVGVEVVEGIAKVGTPLAVPTQAGIELGRIASLELNHKAVDSARAGQSVAMKIEPGNAMEQSRMYGRHFDHNDQLVSKITRESINALKSHFTEEMTKDDWRLVVKLKKVWGVQ